MRIIVIFIALLSLPSFVSGASLYKWRDTSGALHITDSAPPSYAKEVSGGTYIKERQTTSDYQRAAWQNSYYDQLGQINYRQTQTSSAAAAYNDQFEDYRDRRYEQRKAYLEAQIYKFSRAINILDPKKTRDYYRQQRDHYKEQLRILKKYH